MGALVSRTRKGAKAYVLRPFKRRGYFLTQEEYRERNPTLFDKIASGKYTEEAVEKMKLKRRDDFLALRRRTLAKVKDPGTRTSIMKKFFTSHKPPKRTRVNLPHKAWDVAGQTGAGVGSGRLGGVAGAGVPAGMSSQARVVSMDDAPVGALPDPRDIALGRAAGGGRGKNGVGEASTAQSVHGSGSFIDRAFVVSLFLFPYGQLVCDVVFCSSQERDESMHSGSEYDPVRYEQDIYSEYGASVYDDTDYFDGTTVYSGTTTPRAGVYSVHSGVGQMGSQKRRNDIARSHFGLGDPPSKPNDEVGEPLPVTLQRRMVEQDGVPVTYPRPTGLRRWDRYVEDEDRKIADCVEEERRRRAEHNREMRRIYKRKYGRWGKKHVPRPAPTWVDTPHEDAPWRRPRNKEGEVCSTREAVEGFDRELKMGTYGEYFFYSLTVCPYELCVLQVGGPPSSYGRRRLFASTTRYARRRRRGARTPGRKRGGSPSHPRVGSAPRCRADTRVMCRSNAGSKVLLSYGTVAG